MVRATAKEKAERKKIKENEKVHRKRLREEKKNAKIELKNYNRESRINEKAAKKELADLEEEDLWELAREARRIKFGTYTDTISTRERFAADRALKLNQVYNRQAERAAARENLKDKLSPDMVEFVVAFL